MRKKDLTKIFILTVVVAIALLTAFSVSRAEDDNEEGGNRFEEDYRPVTPVLPIQTPSPVIAPQKTITTSVKIDNSAILALLVDSDQDGVADVSDKYPGQDDFSFNLIDNNHNGIADDLEILIK